MALADMGPIAETESPALSASNFGFLSPGCSLKRRATSQLQIACATGDRLVFSPQTKRYTRCNKRRPKGVAGAAVSKSSEASRAATGAMRRLASRASGAHEFLHRDLRGLAQHFCGRSSFKNAGATVLAKHERGEIGQTFREMNFVRHDHNQPGARLDANDLLDLLPLERIECGSGFIHQEHIGLQGDGARDREALRLAAGKFPRGKIEAGQLPGEPHLLERLLGQPANCAAFERSGMLEGELHVCQHRPREHARLLMNETDATSELLFREGGPENGLAIEKNVARAAPPIAAMLDQALGGAEQRAFADTRRTQQSDHPRSEQLQVDAIQDHSLAD